MPLTLSRRLTPAEGAGAFPGLGAAPYVSPLGALLALAAAAVLCWPMLLTSAPLVYFDTISYYTNGAQLWQRAMGAVLAVVDPDALAQLAGAAGEGAGQAAASAGPNAAGGGAGGGGVTFRSIPYAAFFFPAGITPLELVLACVLQTAITLFAFLALVPPLTQTQQRTALAGCAAVGLLSSLPWFASYAMPDILGAVLPVYFALALGRADALGWAQRLVLMAIATFAILSHYGHLPMVAVLAPAALAWRWWRGRLTRGALAFCLLPVAAAFGFNLALSLAVSTMGSNISAAAPTAKLPQLAQPAGATARVLLLTATVAPADAASAAPGVSLAPNRVPVLLARSIEDGPGRWYLEEECAHVDRYAICELFDEIPRSVFEMLWAEDGIRTATDEQMARIRAEETEIVLAAARRYPLQQAQALVGNTLYQATLVGTGELLPEPPGAAERPLTELAPKTADNENDPVLRLFDWITPVFTWLAFLVLAWRVATGRVESWLVEVVAMVLFALLVNAAVYGGLSAPVDRYQSRLAWLIPALLALDLALKARPCLPRAVARQAA